MASRTSPLPPTAAPLRGEGRDSIQGRVFGKGTPSHWTHATPDSIWGARARAPQPNGPATYWNSRLACTDQEVASFQAGEGPGERSGAPPS